MIKRLRSQRGFLLIEALAAFAILSLAMIALFVATSQAVRTDRRAGFELIAARVARAQLDRLDSEIPLSEGRVSGVSLEGFVWTLTQTPYASSASSRAFWATAEVRDGPRVLTVTTLKLARRPPELN